MNGQILAGPPDLFVYLLGGMVAVLTSAVAANSLWALARRGRGEQRFVSLVALNLRDGERIQTHVDSALLERAAEGKLDEADRQRLSPALYAALDELIPEIREPIRRALKQPSDKGRANYESRILSESARQVLQELETTNAAGGADRTARESSPSEPEAQDAASQEVQERRPLQMQVETSLQEVMQQQQAQIKELRRKIRQLENAQTQASRREGLSQTLSQLEKLERLDREVLQLLRAQAPADQLSEQGFQQPSQQWMQLVQQQRDVFEEQRNAFEEMSQQWMEQAQYQQEAFQQVVHQAQETVGEIAQQTQEVAGGAAQQAQDTVGQAAQQAQDAAGGGGQEEPAATHAARQKAQELGIDLSQVEGSGTGGLITVKDVTNTASQGW